MKELLILTALFSILSFSTTGKADDDKFIEEIVVTATKRDESIQEIPIAVSAFAGKELERRGIKEFEGLMEVSPSIAIQQSSNSGQGGSIRIRGVGTAGSNPGLEAAVGTFIDGVYRSRAGQAFSDLGDIKQIEILRGPQGTLFGKNTVAGAVNVISNAPEFGKSAGIDISAGNLDYINFKGFFNADASDTWAFRLSYSWSERDGFVDPVAVPLQTFDDFEDRDRYTVKAQALWVPNDDFTARLIIDYTEKNERCCVAVYTVIDSPSGGSSLPAIFEALGANTNLMENDETPLAGVNFDPFTDIEDEGISLDLNWDINDDMSLRSITAYREFDMHRGVDPDFSTADILSTLDTTNIFENFSQEFQLIGTTKKLDWLVGAYFYTEDMSSDEIVAFSTTGPLFLSTLTRGAFPPSAFSGNPSGRQEVPGHVLNQGYDGVYETETDGWSLFTHDVWHATDQLSFTFGLRFSHEEKKGSGIVNGAAPGEIINDPFCDILVLLGGLGRSFCNNPSFSEKLEEDEFTGTFKIAYQLADDMLLYGGISRGYKAGGFNLDQQAFELDQVTFDPEFSNSLELGVKADFMENRVRLNSALFYTEFDDFQLNTFTGLGFTITNVPEVITQGIEFEGTWVLNDIVSATFGLTYTDARYGDDTPIIVDSIGTDIKGKRLNLSPLWAGGASLFVQDNLPGSAWTYSFNLNWSHVGSVNTGSDLKPEKERGAYNKWNTQLGFTSPSGRYSARIWGRNLGNTIRNNVVANTPLQTGNYSTFLTVGRTYGLTFSALLDQT